MPDNAVYWISLKLKYEKKNSNDPSIGSWGSAIVFPELVFFRGWNLKEIWKKTYPQVENGATQRPATGSQDPEFLEA
ncbi:hypothetical protein VMCG_00544 [Cytospora schulzeri]|uniref:Uncharacterized protein n=1 Tax=Cytospora schulzeri TaxID=448051 RepID=A0A423X848_9PEZI|nr:hypothetical protein VMCG_00544 [Valsa malicola]